MCIFLVDAFLQTYFSGGLSLALNSDSLVNIIYLPLPTKAHDSSHRVGANEAQN